MRSSKGLALVVTAVVLAIGAQTAAAGPTTVTSVYTVGGGTVPGVTTGLVLQPGMSVTATATGVICVAWSSVCPGVNGDAAFDTTGTTFGGFPLPGAPAWGLIGRVGAGAWVQVGSGPTTLTGTGALAFAINDDLLSDNRGSFTVTVTYSCWPGWGYGDKNHTHCGPPGLAKQSVANSRACVPGWGYGDQNHTHCGPPGLAKEPAATRGSANGRAAEGQTESSDHPGKSEPRGEAKGHSKK